MEIATSKILNIYQETLYIVPRNNAPIEPIGNFEKKVLIFYTEIDKTDEAQKLLSNMLQACGLSITDCYLVGIEQTEQVITQINAHNPKYILSFGVNIGNELYKLNTSKLNEVKNLGSAKLILSYNLTSMLTSTNAKTELWNALKKMFNLK